MKYNGVVGNFGILFGVAFILFSSFGSITGSGLNTGNEYYISSINGNDNNDGTSASKAWKSLHKLNTVIPYLKSGDKIYLEKGSIWYESELDISNLNANETSPIQFSTWGNGNKPIISGGINISNSFSNSGNDIWTSNSIHYVPRNYIKTPAGLLINNKFHRIAKHPNDSYFATSSNSKDQITDGSDNWRNNELAGGQVVAKCVYWSWSVSNIIENTSSYIKFKGFDDYTLGQNGSGKTFYFLQNVEKGLDQHGEWIYQNGTLKVKYKGNLNSTIVEFPVKDTLITISNSTNIHFSGIEFRNANAILVDIKNSNNIKLSDCIFRVAGTSGIVVNKVDDLDINNNHFEYLHGNGITADNLGTTYIEKNSFKYTPGVKGHQNQYTRWGAAISTYYGNEEVYVRYNKFDSLMIAFHTHSNYESFYFERNIVRDYGITLGDHAAVYLGGDWKADVPKYIKRNIFIDAHCDLKSMAGSHPANYVHGIYWDYDSRGAVVDSNTFINTNVAIYSNRNYQNKARHNIIFNGAKDLQGWWAADMFLDGIGDGDDGPRDDDFINNTHILSDNPYHRAFLWHSVTYDNFNVNNNKYFHPYGSSNNKVHREADRYSETGDYTINEWCSKRHMDCNSKVNPISLTYNSSLGIDKDDFVKVLYNPTNETKNISLDAIYMDVDGNIHEKYVSIEPYYSKVLFFYGKSESNIEINSPPDISNQTFTVYENGGSNQIGNVHATDIDEEQNLNYTITSGNQENLFVLNNDGSLSFNTQQNVSFTGNPSYKITIKVEDDGSPSLNDQATITINLIEQSSPMNRPPVIHDQQFSVHEETFSENFIGTVKASDPDNNQALSFKISSGKDAHMFEINATNGSLYLRDGNQFNFDGNPKYEMTIEVSDNGSPQLNDIANVNVFLYKKYISLAYPANFRLADVSYNNISFAWEHSDNSEIDGYEIEKTTVETNNVERIKTDAATNTLTDNKILPETRYKYRIRSVRDNNYSGYSGFIEIQSDIHPFSLVEEGPKIINYDLEANSIELHWEYDEIIDHFIIERSIGDSLNFFSLSTADANTFHFNDPINFNDRDIFYRIRAVKDGIFSNYSNIIKTVHPAFYENENINLGFALNSNSTVQLNWNLLDLQYTEVQRSTDNSEFESIAKVKNQNTFQDTIGNYKVLKYRLVGYYNDQLSKTSNAVTINEDYLQSLVDFRLSKIQSDQIQLRWNQNIIPASSFVKIHRADVSSFEILDSVVNNSAYVDRSLKEETLYKYFITYDFNSKIQLTSDTLSITTDIKPTAENPVLRPVILNNYSNAILEWNADTNSYSSYIIEKSVNDTNNFTEITQDNSSGVYKDLNLEEGNHYFYQIKLFIEGDFVANSNIESIYVPMSTEYERDQDGLIASYNFNNNVDQVYDISNYLTPVNLNLTGNANSSTFKSSPQQRKTYISAEPVTKILSSVRNTQEFSLECWIKSSKDTDEDIQQIVSIENHSGKLFSISQDNMKSNTLFDYFVNFRTNSTSESGQPDFSLNQSFEFRAINHIVYTRDEKGTEKFFFNGKFINSNIRPSGLDDWIGDYYLVIGSAIDGQQSWNGEIYYLSIYNKTLSASVIDQHYIAGAYPEYHKTNKQHQVELFPNPTSDVLNVKVVPTERFLSGEKTQLLILNNLGQIIYTKIVEDPAIINQYAINCSDLPAGIYNVILKSRNQLKSKKLSIVK